MSVSSSISGGGFGSTGSGGLPQGSGTVIADERVVRGDTDGLQGSAVSINDAGAVSGVTQLDVDNIRLDGSTISTTNANGSLVLDPNGTGLISLFGSTATDLAFKQRPSTDQVELVHGDGSGRKNLWLGQFTLNETGSNYSLNGAVAKSSQGFRVSSSNLLGWTSGSDADQAPDTAIKRDSAGVQLDTNGSTGLGARLTGRVVEASTAGSGAPNLLAATESRKFLTNEGSTAESYNTLPLAVAGVEFVFYCQDADGIRVVAGTGDTIRIGSTVSAAAGFVRSSTVGSALILTAINVTEWVAISVVGTWTVDL